MFRRDEPGVLVLVDVEDDRAGDGVQQVARGEVAVGLEHHLEREGDVQQADLARGVERVDPRLPRRARFEERALGRVLDAAGGVVADLLDGLLEGQRAEGEEVGRDDVVGDRPAVGFSARRSVTTWRRRASRASKSWQSRSIVVGSTCLMGASRPSAHLGLPGPIRTGRREGGEGATRPEQDTRAGGMCTRGRGLATG